jgi:HSP20 family protein
MNPEDRPRRRRRPFDDFIFGGFDDEFGRMQDHINRIMREVFRDFDTIEPSEIEPGKKYVYGFTMRTGPDGKPVVDEFGNVPRMGRDEVPGEREPLVDVIDGNEEITVIAELPGVSKEDIDLNTDEKSLTINVDTESRKYHKDLKLPAAVKPDGVKAAYKNGVLEVKLKRAEPQKERPKKKITVE